MTNGLLKKIRKISNLTSKRLQEAVDIKDENLKIEINKALQQDINSIIKVHHMQSLRKLDISYCNISDITGLEYAVN